MSSEKQSLTCELCGKGPFRSLAGLAGHAWLAHRVRPGGGLAGVEGKQLVEAQEQLGERFAKLEAALGGVARLLPEQLDKLLSAHRQQLIEVEAVLAEGQEDELAERITKLEAALDGVAKQLPEQLDKIVSQVGKLVEALSKQLPEQLSRALAAQRARHDEQHEQLVEQLEDLERKVMPVKHLGA